MEKRKREAKELEIKTVGREKERAENDREAMQLMKEISQYIKEKKQNEN